MYDYSVMGTVKHSLKVSFEGPLSWDEIEQGKYLIADHNGLLSLLFIKNDQLLLTSLGRLNAVTIVRYLDNRVFYAGSYLGPSYLLRITSNHLDILNTYPNTGPITDMTAVPRDNAVNTQLMGVCGYNEVSSWLFG